MIIHFKITFAIIEDSKFIIKSTNTLLNMFLWFFSNSITIEYAIYPLLAIKSK